VTALDRPPATAVSAEVRVPPPLGAVLVVHHRGDYRLQCEHVREQQAVATAGFSMRYEDAWPAVHGAAPGHTFTPRNALVRAGEMPLERGRRIDYVMVRSSAHGPPLDVADCRVVLDWPEDGVWPSDHFGVMADLRPPPHPPVEWAR
jgi:endonuclease/exonuclease/phosphatase family metal-dependent hydrolase